MSLVKTGMPNAFINKHLWNTASEGSFSPSQVAELASKSFVNTTLQSMLVSCPGHFDIGDLLLSSISANRIAGTAY